MLSLLDALCSVGYCQRPHISPQPVDVIDCKENSPDKGEMPIVILVLLQQLLLLILECSSLGCLLSDCHRVCKER